MKAAILEKITSLKENKQPLKMVEVPQPVIGDGEILVKISVCGVCHTELDEIEGRTPPPKLPVILGIRRLALLQTAVNSRRDSRLATELESVGLIQHAAAVRLVFLKMKISAWIFGRPAGTFPVVMPSIWR
jgi:hypothetical protein